jgi:hypothetical protein
MQAIFAGGDAMKSTSLQTIEKELPRLSQQEQLWLIEHLAQQLRKEQRREEFRAAMEAMANDPEIQAENRRIQEEFSVAEEDGL